jgi:hypothetical protein
MSSVFRPQNHQDGNTAASQKYDAIELPWLAVFPQQSLDVHETDLGAKHGDRVNFEFLESEWVRMIGMCSVALSSKILFQASQPVVKGGKFQEDFFINVDGKAVGYRHRNRTSPALQLEGFGHFQ